MENFPATHFGYATRYPESGTRIQLGNSYQFDTLPEAPDQRIFVLSLAGMAYFENSQGGIDLLPEPFRNLGVLEDFYNRHKRAISFVLPHPIYGDVEVKFNRPLDLPQGIPGGGGVVPTFEVELIEQP